jgi:hypothetical protein
MTTERQEMRENHQGRRRLIIWQLTLGLVAGVIAVAGPALPAAAKPTGIVQDPGFESQHDRWTVAAPWQSEGSEFRGIDQNLGLQKTGGQNAFIRASHTWNALTQRVPVKPNTRYTLTGWVHPSGNFDTGRFGVRAADGRTTLAQTGFGARPQGSDAYQQLDVTFDSGTNQYLTIFVGYTGPNADSWVQIDDIDLGGIYTNWAGYVVPSSPENYAPLDAVTAVWRVPDFTCGAADPRANEDIGAWIGLDGLDTSATESLVQVGTNSWCGPDPSGRVTLQHAGFWEVIDAGADSHTQPIGGFVAAGDEVSASIVREHDDPHIYLVTFSNLTRHWNAPTMPLRATNARAESAEIVIERPHTEPFSSSWPIGFSVPFQYVTVGGATLDYYRRITDVAVSDDRTWTYRPSDLRQANGFSSFTVGVSPA